MAAEPYRTMATQDDESSDVDGDDHDESDYDDEVHSDTSSDITEFDGDDFPLSFTEMDGRLFHSHGSSPYPLPVDAAEQERMNGQHDLLRELLGSNYVGPVHAVLRPNSGLPEGRRTKRALDLGTGTGRWAIEMAQEFPHVKWYGLDIVPIATRLPPDNVWFEMQDVSERLRFNNAGVDLVHARSISMAVRDYPRMLREVARVLRPGGLFLACEWGRYPAITRRIYPRPNIPRSEEFYRVVGDALWRTKGIVPIARDIANHMRASGFFEEIRERTVEMPIGDGHPGATDANRRIGYHFREMLKLYARSMKVMMVNAGVGEAEAESLVEGYIHEMNTVNGMVSDYYMIYGIRRASH